MNDPTIILQNHTKKYHIPLNHLNHRYIEQCTDGLELEQIYKELISEQDKKQPLLEQITLDRIRIILPNSQIFRQNNEHERTVPKSNDKWEKFEQKVSKEFNSDNEDEQSTDNESNNHQQAEQYRLNGNTAFQKNNYQQSIDLYTKSLHIEKDLTTYINRAMTHYQLNNYDAAIQDCSDILKIDPNYTNALSHRARCYLIKKQHDEAKQDLEHLLSIDSDNSEGQDLLNTLSALVRTDDDNNEIAIQSPTIIRLNSRDEQENLDSPTIDNHEKPNQFHISSSNDDDDDLALGDEASANIPENISDDEIRRARSINVSPTIDEDSDTQELLQQKPLTNSIDHRIAFQINDNKRTLYQNNIHQNNNKNDDDDDDDDEEEEDDLYDSHRNKNDTTKNNQNLTVYDAIANSNFGSIIQSWLRDLVASQPNRRFYNPPWSRNSRPWALDKIQRDIDRYERFNDYRNAIEVSKKMLQNGVLDYHNYEEYITDTLRTCAQCYLKLQNYPYAIQYATEALQYNRRDVTVLLARGKAFETENFLLFSYADYARVPTNSFDRHLAQRACERVSIELDSTENDKWRDKLSNDHTDDDERFLIYLKQKTNYSSDDNLFEWYEKYADQFFNDACFVLAIRFYTYCIELQSSIPTLYLKRAACYLKVYEPQKVIDDCELILKDDQTNLLALYYKASAYKLTRDYHLYEITLKEYIKLEPHNQIILTEYYNHKHEQMPRKKRRIRRISTDDTNNQLTYNDLEEIRLNKSTVNPSLDSNNLKDQCAYLLQLDQIDFLTTKLIESIITISHLMIKIEENYQHDYPTMVLPYSYIKYCFHLLCRLTTLPQMNLILSMIDQNSKDLLEELVSYYSTRFDDTEKLNQLKNL